MYLLDRSQPGYFDEVFRLLDRFGAASAQRRALDVECARILAQLHELDAWSFANSAGAADMGERYAMPAQEARNLLDVGLAMKTHPYLENQVLTGRLTVPAAALVGQVFAEPRLQQPEDDWVGWAQSETTAQLRKRVQRRKEEARLDGQPAVAMTFFVKSMARDDFKKARDIASRKAGEILTEGETFEKVVDTYLDVYDEDRVEPGKRRLPDTAFVIDPEGKKRYVPAAVRREILERQGHKCCVPFCDNSKFLDMAHLVWHASRGSREADNLILLCTNHHLDFDDGYFRLTGTAAEPGFVDRNGRDLSKRFMLGFQAYATDPDWDPKPVPYDERPDVIAVREAMRRAAEDEENERKARERQPEKQQAGEGADDDPPLSRAGTQGRARRPVALGSQARAAARRRPRAALTRAGDRLDGTRLVGTQPCVGRLPSHACSRVSCPS